MTVTIEQVRAHIEGIVAAKCGNATAGQRAAIVERLMDQDAVRDEVLRPIMLREDIGAEMNLDTILRTEPDVIRAAPSVADIIEHNARKYRENLGYEPPTEVRMNLYREFADADADERLATGVEAGIAPKNAETSPPGRAPGSQDYHNWPIDDPRFSDVLRERGFDVNNLLPSKRREYIEALQAQSYTNLQRAADATSAALSAKTAVGRPLTAEDRITAHRLNEERK